MRGRGVAEEQSGRSLASKGQESEEHIMST